MNEYEHSRTEYHHRGRFAALVYKTAEYWSKYQRPHSGKSDYRTGEIGIYAVFRHHKSRCKLLEREYASIEQYAQKGYEPETSIGKYVLYIRKREFLIVVLRIRFRLLAVELFVHYREYEKSYQSTGEEYQAYQYGRFYVEVARNGYCNRVCRLGAYTGQSHLYAHRRCHFLTFEPAGDYFRHGDTGYFRPDTEY